MPKVSIIVPIYNVEKYISKCLESILNQTFTDFEAILIDDGSPDRSVEIINKYNDSRIKLFRKDNGGLSDARNYGLERANGDYIVFVDSDDWIEADFLDDCISYLDSNKKVDLIILGYIKDFEDKDERIIKSEVITPESKLFCISEKNIEFNSQVVDLMGYSVNKVYRRSLLKKGNFKFKKDITLVEDSLFNFDVFSIVSNILFLDKAYYHYRIKPVETLMYSYRNNPFSLIKMKINSLERLLRKWDFPELSISRAISISVFNGMIYAFNNIFVFQHDLNPKQQKSYVKSLFKDPIVKKYVKYYPSGSINSKLLKQLIEQRNYYLIKFLFKFRSFLRNN